MCELHLIAKIGNLIVCQTCGWYIVDNKKELKVTELTWKEYKEWKNKKISTQSVAYVNSIY